MSDCKLIYIQAFLYSLILLTSSRVRTKKWGCQCAGWDVSEALFVIMVGTTNLLE